LIRHVSHGAERIKQQAWAGLWLLALLTAGLYLALLALGPAHTLAVPGSSRPILLVMGLYAGAFVLYWLAWWLATHLAESRRLLWWLLGTSIAWRAFLLPTPPFQEIDIYRYLWDGAVARHGCNPYHYPPEQVIKAIDANRQGAISTGPLAKMVDFATRAAPEHETIVRQIHFGELPSPYPPVSQAVFAAASFTSPASTVEGHLRWLKLVLTGFDLATLLVVIWLLRITGLHMGHAIAYGWCPLVMKEIAGSGHLDSIATFLAVLALALAARSIAYPQGGARWLGVLGASVALAAGVAAKLFPIILAPLLVILWWRKLGWRESTTGAATVALATWLLMWPMLAGNNPPAASPTPAANMMLAANMTPAPAAADASQRLSPPPDLLPPDLAPPAAPGADKRAGLAAFLSRWEMNDLMFAVTVENLRDQSHVPRSRRPWFGVVPGRIANRVVDDWKKCVSTIWPAASDWSRSDASFLLARALTGGVFGLLALALAWRAAGPRAGARELLAAAFLTLAWFWLLAPTQNPWYWCWALPLLPFARCRAWALLAACALLYYLRFWLEIHFLNPPVLGTPYNGEYFFYFVVNWIEFGPWLLLLAVEAAVRWAERK